jgi:outer membrane protein OmpA-like peptidoglycan-associated protein
MKRAILFLCYFFPSFYFFGQNGELGQFDCTYSKEVIVPFSYSEDPKNPAKPLLDQKVFYSFRDQFSFWYKIVVKEDHQLNFKVTALNDSDAYSVFVYQYNLPDICNKVYHQKIAPVKANFFIGKGSATIKETDKTFKALKNNTYYVSVLNTSINNCGHRFRLIYGKDTLKVDALHLPCKRDVSSLSASAPTVLKKNEDTKPLLVKKDSVVTTPVFFKDSALKQEAGNDEKNLIVTVVTLNAKNKKNVESKLFVYSKKDNLPAEVNLKSKGEFIALLKENNAYTIKAEALGYQPQELTREGTELKLKGKEEILMEPVKEGESFILKRIYFVPNTYALRKESKEELEKLLAFMKNNENTVLEIQGHTNGDNRIYKNKVYANLGDEWNFSGSSKKLSQKRAEAIKEFLTKNGIAESRLVAKGYGGEKYLVKDPETNEEAQRNIRVEVSVLKN